jgi:hypothetical protein
LAPEASATPLPTPNFAPEDIAGTWTRADPERGQLYLIIDENGSYVAAHGSPEGFVRAGEYSIAGVVFTWVKWDDCPPGDYVARLAGGGEFLVFEVLNDPECDDRRDALGSKRWDRVAPTPAP